MKNGKYSFLVKPDDSIMTFIPHKQQIAGLLQLDLKSINYGDIYS